jgi:ketosteroid isomerase-like protein
LRASEEENVMAEEGSGIGDRLSGAVQRIKGGGDDDQERTADEVGGRVEVVRKALHAFGQGEHDQFLEFFHEEVEWVGPEGSNFPGSGTHQGRDAVRENFVDDIGEGYPAFGFRPDHYLDADEQDWVVTLGVFTGEGGTDQFEVPGVVVWEFRDDKVGTVRIYTDTGAFPRPLEEDEREREGEEKEDGEGEEGEDGQEAKAEQEDDGPQGSDEERDQGDGDGDGEREQGDGGDGDGGERDQGEDRDDDREGENR